jgi:hypothetical protein
MTITPDAPIDMVDELESKWIAARYTCPACGRIKCKCGRTPAVPDAKPAKSNVSTDLSEDEPAVSFDQWAKLNPYDPVAAMRNNVSPNGPWYSDWLPDIESLHLPPVLPSTPGFLADFGRPSLAERAAMRERRRW